MLTADKNRRGTYRIGHKYKVLYCNNLHLINFNINASFYEKRFALF